MALEKSTGYTTKSLYNCLTHGGVRDKVHDILWKCKIPIKVKVFLWQAIHNKLQTVVALVRRKWRGSPLCCVYNKLETVNHILFECVFAQFIWCCVRDVFNLQGFPLSIQDLISQWMPRRLGVTKKLCFAFFAGLAWAIWKNRNKMAIEKNLPINPDAVIHMAINFLNMWADLHNEADKVKMVEMARYLENWMTWKKSFEGHCSDIMII